MPILEIATFAQNGAPGLQFAVFFSMPQFAQKLYRKRFGIICMMRVKESLRLACASFASFRFFNFPALNRSVNSTANFLFSMIANSMSATLLVVVNERLLFVPTTLPLTLQPFGVFNANHSM